LDFYQKYRFPEKNKKPGSGILINRSCQSVPDFLGRNQKGSRVNTEPGVQCVLFFHRHVLKQEFGMVEGVVALKEARSPLDF
jgi:hypothetical protein